MNTDASHETTATSELANQGQLGEQVNVRRRLLISGPGADTLDTYASLLSTHGFETFRGPLEFTALNASKVEVAAVLLVGIGSTGDTAVAQVKAMRDSSSLQARDTPALLLGSSELNLALAWKSGIDGFLELPVELNDVVAAVNEIVERPTSERYAFRQAQLSKFSQ